MEVTRPSGKEPFNGELCRSRSTQTSNAVGCSQRGAATTLTAIPFMRSIQFNRPERRKGRTDLLSHSGYPAIPRDATAYNWRRKKNIFADSRLYISAPCHWLLEEMQQSMVASGIVESRIIPYGIDLSNFHPTDRRAVRAKLGIPDGAKVLLFAANGVRRNPFKDYETIRAAVAQVSERMPSQEVLFIALGEDLPEDHVGSITVRFVPYETDVGVVANYFQAADLYVHAAKADTFPNVV